jgi:hypothetical protein
MICLLFLCHDIALHSGDERATYTYLYLYLYLYLFIYRPTSLLASIKHPVLL